MKKINVLFVMLQMEMGGSERLVYNLVRSLDRTAFNVSVAWFYGSKPLKEFPKNRRIDLSAMRRLKEVIRENDIDVVNAHHFMSLVYSWYGVRLKKNCRLVYTEHSKWEIERLAPRWKIMGRHLLNHADAAVGVSTQVSREIETCFKMDCARVATIENGVIVEGAAHPDDKDLFRKSIGLDLADFVIGIVANLKKIKNHAFLLKAFDQLGKENPRAKLLLIGQGFEADPENCEQELRNFVAEQKLEDRVLFLGYRSDIPQLLSVMDIFCLTSFREGLPISLIEAMAAGLPVVGTDVEGIRDVIVPGKNGFLVSLTDPTGLQKVLSLLAADEPLRRRLGKESKARAAASYSLANCTKHYEELFLSLCGGSQARGAFFP
jgi:glycosyltransferase involved in cell wall biosynthesis